MLFKVYSATYHFRFKFSFKQLKSLYRLFGNDSNNRRVVITGLGIVCPLGIGIHNVWDKLLSSEVGTVALTLPEYNKIPCKVAAFVPKSYNGDCYIKSYFKPSDLKTISLTTAYALIATEEALNDAQWFPEKVEDCEKTGVAVGTGMVDLVDIVNTGNMLSEKGYNKVSPYFVPRILANMAAGNIAIKYNFKGPNHAVSTACATGLHAVGDAYNFICNNQASVMVCGSSEAIISPLSLAAFSRIRALSTHFNDEPKKASRPFDKDRDGFVMGEGAGILILESLEHAQKRNAKVYAEIVGYGLSGDAYHITSPCANGNGAYRCMKQALFQSGLRKTDIGYINAHATSTPVGDDIELRAIYDLFGEHSNLLTVSSTKGATGHLLGASGSIEAIFTVLSCSLKQIPPNINLDNPDNKYSVNLAGKSPITWSENNFLEPVGLTNSFGFGGTNASIIFRGYQKAT